MKVFLKSNTSRKDTKYFDALDLLAITFAIILSIIRPPHYDESWIWFESRTFVSSNSQLWDPAWAYFSSGLLYPTSQVYVLITGLISSLTSSLIVARLPFTIAAITVWLIVSSKTRSLSKSLKIRMGLWTIWGLWAAGWIFIRPEVMLGAISIAIIYLIKSESLNTWWKPPIGLSLGAFALSMHPLGLITFPLLLILMLKILSQVPREPTKGLISIVSAISSGVLILFAGGGLPSVLQRFDEWNKRTQRQLSLKPVEIVKGELQRFEHLMYSGDSVQRIFLVILITSYLALIIEFLLRIRKMQLNQNTLILISLLIMPVFLFVGNSKWAWHLGSLIAIPLVAFLIMTTWNRVAFHLFWISSLGVGLFLVYESAQISWNPITKLEIILVIIALSATILISFKYLKETLRTFLAALVIILIVASEAQANFTSTNSEYSWLRQSILGIISPNERCGLSNYFEGINSVAIEIYAPIALLAPCTKTPLVIDGRIATTPEYSLGPLFSDRLGVATSNPKVLECIKIRARKEICLVKLFSD